MYHNFVILNQRVAISSDILSTILIVMIVLCLKHAHAVTNICQICNYSRSSQRSIRGSHPAIKYMNGIRNFFGSLNKRLYFDC